MKQIYKYLQMIGLVLIVLFVVGCKNASTPQITTNSSGDALAIWQSKTSATDEGLVYTKNLRSDELINVLDLIDSSNPQIVMNSAGYANAVWSLVVPRSSNHQIIARHYVPSNGWLRKNHILNNVRQGVSVSHPKVAINSSRNYQSVVVWNESRGTVRSVWSSIYDSSERRWSRAERVGTGGSPEVAIDNRGNAMMVWEYEFTIWAKRYLHGSGWQSEERISTPDASAGSLSPKIVMNGRGNVIVVWYKFKEEIIPGKLDSTIYARHYSPRDGWGVENDIGPENSEAATPQIKMNPSGDTIVVWNRQGSPGDGNSTIWSNVYNSSSGWGTAELISGESNRESSPQVAINTRGEGISVWRDATSGIWYNRTLGSPNGWEVPRKIMESDSTAFSPQVGVSNTDSIVVWTQSDGEKSIFKSKIIREDMP